MLRCVLVSDNKYVDSKQYKLIPFGNSHVSAQNALADALKLKLGGFHNRQLVLLNKLGTGS